LKPNEEVQNKFIKIKGVIVRDNLDVYPFVSH